MPRDMATITRVNSVYNYVVHAAPGRDDSASKLDLQLFRASPWSNKDVYARTRSLQLMPRGPGDDYASEFVLQLCRAYSAREATIPRVNSMCNYAAHRRGPIRTFTRGNAICNYDERHDDDYASEFILQLCRACSAWNDSASKSDLQTCRAASAAYAKKLGPVTRV
jgi:hypothetical protein